MVKISLNKIPSGNIYLKLDKKLIDSIFNIINKSNTILPESIKSQLYRMNLGKKTSLSFIKNFSLNMDIPLEEFEKNTILITSIKSTNVGIKEPKIPIDFATKEGVRFIASVMGDGELNKQLNIRYNNQSRKLIDIILNSAKKIFGDIDFKLYYRKDKTYQLHFPKIAGIIVSLLGIKPGYKSKNNYGIPSFIFQLDNKLKAVFIRQFFNDEGNVRLKDRRLQIKQTIECKASKKEAKSNIMKYAPKSLLGIQKLLLDLGVDSKISLGMYRNGKIDWELSAYRIENLSKFKENIGFDLEYKNKLLGQAIKSYKFPSAARNGRIDFALRCCKKAQENYGFITKEILAKTSNRSLKTATYYLVDLKKRKLIKCIEKPKKRDEKSLSHRYIIS